MGNMSWEDWKSMYLAGTNPTRVERDIKKMVTELHINSDDLKIVGRNTLHTWFNLPPGAKLLKQRNKRNKWLMMCRVLRHNPNVESAPWYLDVNAVNNLLDLLGVSMKIQELYQLAVKSEIRLARCDSPAQPLTSTDLDDLAVPPLIRKNVEKTHEYVGDLMKWWAPWRDDKYAELARADTVEVSVQRASGVVHAVAWRSDGNILASGGTWAGETVRFWDWSTEPVQLRAANASKKPDETVLSLAWSANGQILAGGDITGRVSSWIFSESTAFTPKYFESSERTGAIRCVAVSPEPITFRRHWEPPDDKRYVIATGGDDNAINLWVWDAQDLKSVSKLAGHSGIVRSVVFLDNNYLASTGDDKTIRVWDIRSAADWKDGKEVACRSCNQPLNCLIYVPRRKALVGGGNDGMLYHWKWNNGANEPVSPWKWVKNGEEHDDKHVQVDGPIKCIAARPTDMSLAVGTTHAVYLLAFASGAEYTRLSNYYKHVYSVAWSPNGVYLATGDGAGRIRIWKMPQSHLELEETVQ